MKRTCNKCKQSVDFDFYDTQDKLCFKCYKEEWGKSSPQDHREEDAEVSDGEVEE